jgi:phosphate/sulfate permease
MPIEDDRWTISTPEEIPMANSTLVMNPPTLAPPVAQRPHLDAAPHPGGVAVFFGVLFAALLYIAYNLYSDVSHAGTAPRTVLPFVLLGVALLIALGFEFVNGFHDTANAVATVIYTHSLPAHAAVIWSGLFNFLGVLVSSGAVAYGIIALLPVELILKVGSASGFAMVFALLIGAIVWNLGTWWFGLPASSSHTLIGSIIGVGLANQLRAGADQASGVDWAQAAKIGYSLLLSPLVGFGAAALLLLTLRMLVRRPELYQEPRGTKPPPLWVRSLLILTCTGVSFAHGSNDGQKGMGLIMLILIGVVPTAYALNRSVPDSAMPAFLRTSSAVVQAFDRGGAWQCGGPNDHRELPPNARRRPRRPDGDRDALSQHCHAGATLRISSTGAGSGGGERPQQHVSGLRGHSPCDQGVLAPPDQSRHRPARGLQERVGRCDPVHSHLGQSGGRRRARARDDGGLEAHRHHRRREDRQEPFEL